jgi:hypothetical protein
VGVPDPLTEKEESALSAGSARFSRKLSIKSQKTNCSIPAHCQARNKALRHPDKQLKVDNIRSKGSDGLPDPRLIEHRKDKTSAEGDADLQRGGETSEAGL